MVSVCQCRLQVSAMAPVMQNTCRTESLTRAPGIQAQAEERYWLDGHGTAPPSRQLTRSSSRTGFPE